MFFTLIPADAQLSDVNQGLIDSFAAVRDDVDSVIQALRELQRPVLDYYWLRDKMEPADRWQAAARFVALNKTCWNGLYRENLEGHFNVPIGTWSKANIINEPQLRAASRSLQGATLLCCDFEQALVRVAKSDFVFLDPPYVTAHRNNGFTEYNARLFNWEDQLRLSRVCRTLRKSGATFIMTNGSHSSIERLYRPFEIHRIRRKSTIASDPRSRRRCEELLIVGGTQ